LILTVNLKYVAADLSKDQLDKIALNILKRDAGGWHKGIRHNLLFPSIWKGAYTERSTNGKNHKGKRHKGKRHKGIWHNQVFAKSERGVNGKRQKGIWQNCVFPIPERGINGKR
jgi:hypothetical protein